MAVPRCLKYRGPMTAGRLHSIGIVTETRDFSIISETARSSPRALTMDTAGAFSLFALTDKKKKSTPVYVYTYTRRRFAATRDTQSKKCNSVSPRDYIEGID